MGVRVGSLTGSTWEGIDGCGKRDKKGDKMRIGRQEKGGVRCEVGNRRDKISIEEGQQVMTGVGRG